MITPPTIKAPTGTKLNCKGWHQEAAYRMIQNNLDPENAENPNELIVYGGLGKAARNWEAFDAILETLKELKNYFLELGSGDESDIMFDYYESKGWKVGNAPMKCWKSATRNWIRRLNKKNDFPDYYDKKVEITIGNDSETLSKYHNHLKKLGWESKYSPSAGITWKKIKK